MNQKENSVQQKQTRVEPKKIRPMKKQKQNPAVSVKTAADYEKFQSKDFVTDVNRSFNYNQRTTDLVDSAMQDGVITNAEFLAIQSDNQEIVRDFLVAYDILRRAEKNPDNYTKQYLDSMRFIVNHLMIARDKSYAALYRTAYYNSIPEAEQKKRKMRRNRKEYIKVKITPYLLMALNGNAHKLVDFAREEEKKRVMTPQEAERIEKRIEDLANELIENGRNPDRIQEFLKEDKELHR